jgi:hypothetical protein
MGGLPEGNPTPLYIYIGSRQFAHRLAERHTDAYI